MAEASAKSEMPVVLVFQVAQSRSAKIGEARFITELRLALDRFRIHCVSLEPRHFASLVFAERLERIRSLSQQHGAVATTWIEYFGQDTVLLSLVAMSTGRALVRVVEVESGPSTEAELAFAAQELLGEAYMFGDPSGEPAIEETVQRVKQNVTGHRPSGEAKTRLGVVPLFSVSGGIYEREGPSLLLGGGAGLELNLVSSWFFRLSLLGWAGPRQRYDDGVLSGFGVTCGLGAGYHFLLGPLRLGPMLGAALNWRRMDMAFGEGDNQPYTWVGFRGEAAVDLQLAVRDHLLLVLGGGIGIVPVRKSFQRVSDESTLVSTPFVDWHGILGLLIYL
jgi:hypothetical protein